MYSTRVLLLMIVDQVGKESKAFWEGGFLSGFQIVKGGAGGAGGEEECLRYRKRVRIENQARDEIGRWYGYDLSLYHMYILLSSSETFSCGFLLLPQKEYNDRRLYVILNADMPSVFIHSLYPSAPYGMKLLSPI